MPLVTVISSATGQGASPASSESGDPDFDSVVLLTHLDADPPVDVSSYGRTLTPAAGCTLDTGTKKFGAGSYLGDDSANAYIGTPDSAELALGADPFTIEFFYRTDHNIGGVEYQSLMAHLSPSDSNRSWYFVTEGSVVRFKWSYTGGGLNQLIGSTAILADTWYHIAVDRDASNDLRLYVDGAVEASTNVSTNSFFDTPVDLRIGNWVGEGEPFDGWIDEVRITVGVARYGGAFTPPSEPFPDS